MNKIKLNWFEILSLSWMSVNLVVLIFLILGFLNIIWLLIIFLTIFLTIFYSIKNGFVELKKTSGSFKTLSLVVFMLALLLSFYTTPTIFGGRDEGSYSNLAIIMADEGQRFQESKLIENFYGIYGTSKALNFPGFEYNSEGQLESQFLPGYPSWLAVFYKFFGLVGLKFVNLMPFLTFVLSFYLLIIEVFPLIKNSIDPKECLNGNIFKKCWLNLTQAQQFGWLASILILSLFPFLLFYKFTLSEIYFASLIWFSLYLLIRYLKSKNFIQFKILFIPLILMLFVRIETIAIIFALLLIMIGKDFNHLKQARYQFFFVFSGFIFLITVWLDPNFFINAFKGVSNLSSEPGLNSARTIIPNDWEDLYILKIWFNYNLLPFFIMSVVFLTIFLKTIFKNKKFGNEKAFIIIPLLLLSPTLIYLIDANVSLDHPWILRRWIFSIIPLIVFYSIFFLFYLREKNRFLFRMIVIFLIISNVTLFYFYSNTTRGHSENILTFSQNENLLNQVKEISKLFSEEDLILISQNSSGSGWSLISEPMRNVFGLNAVYFFNQKDYRNLKSENFEEIFLISTDEEESLYNEIPKEKIEEKIIKNKTIKPSKEPLEKPQLIESETKINIYKIIK
jgi:hypothetical protein